MTTTRFSLAGGTFSQDWSNAGLITANDDWSGVPSIVGYRGDDVVTATGVDPRTIIAAATSAVVPNVIANQNPANGNPSTGGVYEVDGITNRTIALNGSGTADAPSIVLYLDATGRQDVRFQANVRDLDASADNAIQQVAVQYRVGGGNWTNAAYVADATTAGSATQVTPIDVILGADANNASTLEVRIITTNAVGNDELIGIDDIRVSSTAAAADTTPPALAAFNPADPDDGAVAVDAASNIVLRFTETVQGVAGDIVISDGMGDTRTIAVTDTTQVAFSGATVTINPVADLIAGHTYSVTTAAGTIADTAGNAFAGLPAGALDFTVAAPLVPITIGAIQGLGHMSQYTGTIVRTEGVVTAVDSNGYYIQSASGRSDGDVRTSDGILVFTGSAPTGIAVGDLLQVDGTVVEFRPGGAQGTNNLTTTELTNTTVLHLGFGTVDPVIIGAGHLLPPTSIVDNDNFATYDPQQDGIDFYESLEGMKVTIDAPQVVANTNSFGETYVVASHGVGSTGLNANGGLTISATDSNPERIQLDDDQGLFAGAIGSYSVGDQLASVSGIVSYAFGAYEVLVTEALTQTLDVTAPRDITTLVGDATHLTVADYNLENADPTDPAAKFASLARDIVENLRAPDIISVQEVQDADGAGNGTNYSGQATADRLIAAIDARGGPHYTYIEIAPTANNTTGGEPNGNIRNGYLYNAARVDYVAGSAKLVPGPFAGTRSPLAADFVFNTQVIHLINVHSTSRGGSDEQFGATQPPADAGDAARTAQAQAVNTYVQALLAADPAAKISVQGDFNGFTWEPAIQSLVAGGLTDLNTLLAPEERYSYVFDGNTQQIDHMLTTGNLLAGAQFDPVHLNAELTDGTELSTDHDPLLARFDFGITLNGTNNSETLNGGAGSETINGLNGNDVIFGNGGDDTINGGFGNDTILGGAGFNRLFGGDGNDIFGPETVRGIQIIDGGAGTDTYYIAAGGAAVTVDLAAGTVTGGLGDGSTLTSIETVSAAGTTTPVTIRGADAAETLTGGDGADVIDGRGGNDRIGGGLGADTLTGGAGNDQFVFRRGEVNGDVITDFDGRGAAAGDQLLFTGFGRGAYLSHVDNVWQLHYDGNKIETFTLNVTTLHANDIVFG